MSRQCELEPLTAGGRRCGDGYMFDPGTRWTTIVWRVLVHNPDAFAYGETSLIGYFGHWERSNAWTHIVAAVALAAYFATMLRFWITDGTIHTPAAVLSLVATACAKWTFCASATFHVLCVDEWKLRLRWMDHASIYLLLAAAAAANVALTTNNFERDTPVTSVIDEACAALLLAVYFGLRDVAVPAGHTISWGTCAFGLFRRQQSDGVHAGTRASSYIALICGGVLHGAAVVRNIPSNIANVVLACGCAAIVSVIAGKVNDDYFMWPDARLQRAEATSRDAASAARRVGGLCTCYLCPTVGARCIVSWSCGCIMNHHEWWHVAAAAAVMLLTVARDLVIVHRAA